MHTNTDNGIRSGMDIQHENKVTCEHHRSANADSWALLDQIHAEIDPKIERMKKLIYTKEELQME